MTQIERNYKKESEIKGIGYSLLLILSLYQNYNGYGALEMTYILFICVVVIIIYNLKYTVK